MTSGDPIDRIKTQVQQKAKHTIENKAKEFVSLVKYEISVMNTQLAMASKEHGYDFKFINPAYADSIIVGTAVSHDNTISLSVSVPQNVLKDASDGEVAFLKEFIFANAMTKLHRNQ